MYNEELISAKVAARNAGKILMKYYQSDNKEVKMKGVDNPVTIADNEADQYLCDFLTGEFPNDGWLSEETVDTDERLNKDRVWIVDPLDGTKEFIEGIPHFSVSIGLVYNSEPVVGVIYNPATDEMFSCQKGKGVYLNGNKVIASKKNLLIDSKITVSRSELKRNEWEPYKNNFKSIDPIGSVAYKLALVSAGKYDIFATVAPKNEWDICAGDCLISEAGGVFKTINDKKIIYNQKKTLVTDTIIATNFILFEGVSDLLF
ncbi:MAG: 3'(2'),5'-bisphosphate nucleotidase CysQ [Chloroflexi bacterium]|nr:3'(2'),5'-bisphosphate nucleotidase CysQ [Chloroflexota bacterium]